MTRRAGLTAACRSAKSVIWPATSSAVMPVKHAMVSLSMIAAVKAKVAQRALCLQAIFAIVDVTINDRRRSKKGAN